MSLTLMLLALPLLLLPWLVRDRFAGGAASQMIVVALCLAALQRGIGSLDPVELRHIVAGSPNDAWFVAVTLGALISGGCLLPDIANWRKLIVALPLLVGAGIATPLLPVPLVIGGAVGVVPAVGAVLRRRTQVSGTVTTANRPDALLLLAGVVAAVAALAGPMVICVVGLLIVAWRGRRPARFSATLLAGCGIVALVIWTWLALTIAGDPLIGFARFAVDAPVSTAANLSLALLGIIWLTAIAAPWPLDRMRDAMVTLPVLAVVSAMWTPGVLDGLLHWQPLLTTVLVIAALAGAATRRWTGAAAALLVLAGTRIGGVAIAASFAAAVTPLLLCLVPSAKWVTLTWSLAAALTAAAVLHDQVVAAVVLGLGLAFVSNWRGGVVAPPSVAVHL